MKKKTGFHLTAPQTIAVSFAAMILVGTCLLTLPIASQNGQSVGFLNALFTATSANCVTGLTVVNTLAHWSLFGQIVILVLIQLGGLGFITILTFSMLVLRKRILLRSRVVIQAAFSQDDTGGMVRLVRKVLRITLTIEAIGAVLLAIIFYAYSDIGVGKAIWHGIFHAVSAFCNAGFDLIGDASLVPYQTNIAINAVIMCLVIAGGLGFTVWGELIPAFDSRKVRMHRRLSLHAKLAIFTTAGLLFAGLVIFLVLEWNNPETLGNLNPGGKILAAMFQSVTLRTAGFYSIPQEGLGELSKLASSIFMFVGGSPAGTAGGVKTISIAVIFVAVMSALRGKQRMEVFGRTLPSLLLQKALTVVCMLLSVVVISTVTLHFSEAGNMFEHNIIDLIFESASAAGTVGNSTGITPYLSVVGKSVITLSMYLGRIGPITMLLALNLRLRESSDDVIYPQERVIIG